MKHLATLLFVFCSLNGMAQQGECEFPTTWYPDRSTLSATKHNKVEGSTTINVDVVVLPDSVTFTDGNKLGVWYDGNSITGTYKISKNRIKWSLKDDASSMKIKSAKGKGGTNYQCEMIENGISFFSNRKKPTDDFEKWITISYLIKPSK